MAEESFMTTGTITISTGLSDAGQSGLKFNIEGMSPIQAIGAIQIVLDLIRAKEMQGWAKGGFSGSEGE